VIAAELQQYLYDRIPLSRAMAVSAISVGQNEVVLRAPLAPNINQHETVFGGSASALAILAAWSLLHTRLRLEGVTSRLVIQRNTMEYEQPILGEFTARSTLEQPALWQQFIHTLVRKGRARICVSSVLEYAGQVVGRLSGEFVALDAQRA
jgi:thioesterase domain-containing protein